MPLGTHGGERIAQQGQPLAFRRGGAEGRDEGERLGGPKRVTFDRLQDGLLMLLAQGTQGVGQRGTDRPTVHATLRGRRELGGERTAAGDPGLAPSEQAGYGREAEVIVFVERSDHPRFVHGSGCARRRVRSQQEPFDLRRRTGALDDGGDRALSAVVAVSQAFEAIDDFERAVLLRHDPDRQLGQPCRVGTGGGTA